MPKFLREYKEWAEHESAFLILESIYQTKGLLQEEILTLQPKITTKIFRKLKIDEKDIFLLGSAGKKKSDDISYNQDIGINLKSILKNNDVSEANLHKFILEKFDKSIIKAKIVNDKINLYYPLGKSQFLECKLHFTKNPEWLKFSRHTPSINESESEYTGQHRRLLLQSICECSEKKILSYFDDGKKIKEYQINHLDENLGIVCLTKSFQGRHGVLIEAIPILENSRLITNSVQEFKSYYFGSTKSKLNSVENIYEELKSESFKFEKKVKRILENYKKKLRTKNLEFPKFLK